MLVLAGAAITIAFALSAGAPPAQAAFTPPKIRHVFVIMLENQGYAATFGNPSADPYLAQALPAQGALLENYFATGHASNDNYISLVSGQPPNAQNQADCPQFDNFTGALMLSSGVETGTGCVYPAEVPNIGTQLSALKLTWKAYQEDMGNDPNREAAACGRPAVGSTDETQKAVAGDGYATRHDPFVYFHSVIDEQAFCDRHVVALGSPTGVMPAAALRGETGLATDLTAASKTPRFSFITPNLCNDGHDFPCERSLRARGHRRLPRNVGAEDHELPGIPRKRAARGRLRRGVQLRNGSVLRRDAGTGLAPSGDNGPRRRQGRRFAALAVHQGRDGDQDLLQPLLLAGQLGVDLRARPARRRSFGADRLRSGHLHRDAQIERWAATYR
jgi:hypothetical protein